jgi:hypothetical protein
MWCKPKFTTIMEVCYNDNSLMSCPEMFKEMSEHLDLDYYLIKGVGGYSSPITADERHFELAIQQIFRRYQKML